MWQQDKKDSAIVSLALLLALATTPMAANLFVAEPLLAQSATDKPSFPLPQTVENGTTVRIDGSNSLAAINQSLKQSFEQQFSGTKVEIASNGTDAALNALLEGKIDIAAMGRGLTPEEQAKGLEQVRVHREKIAIIVSKDNPFKGSLTDRQFARIFRGRITDWSEVGRTKGKIRVIDRPSSSDTREALNNYPVFQAAKFATGSTATQLTEDNTAEIVKQLGKDGISYARVNQLSKLSGVRVLRLHQALPKDAAYPFSQPLVYVYKKNPSPNVAAFLGFAIAQPGQKAIEEARVNEAAAIAGESLQPFVATNPTTTPNAETPLAATATLNAEATPVATATPNTSKVEQPSLLATSENNRNGKRQIPLWWLLLPVAVVGGSLLWFLRPRPSTNTETDNQPELTPDSPLGEDGLLTSSESPELNHLSQADTSVNEGTALVGAATLSKVTEKTLDSQKSDGTVNLTHSAQTTTLEMAESPWDIEAPAAVVNTAYPQIPDVSTITSNVQLPKEEVLGGISDLPDVPETLSESEALDRKPTPPQTEANGLADTTSASTIIIGSAAAVASAINTAAEQPEAREMTSDRELSKAEVIASLPELPEVPELSEDEEWDIEFVQGLPAAQAQLETNGLVEIPATANATSTDDAADAKNNINGNSNFTEIDTPDASQFTSDVQSSKEEIIASLPELPNILEPTGEENENVQNLTTAQPEAQSNWLEDITSTDSTTPPAEADIWSTSTELSAPEFGELTTSPAVLPDISEETLNVVADEAEPAQEESISHPPEVTEDFAQSSLADFVNGAAQLGIGLGAWANNSYGIDDTPAEQPAQSTRDEVAVALLDSDEETSITLTPRTPTLAYVIWDISENQQQRLENAGISQLALRLYDVSEIDLSYQSPKLVEQHECVPGINDRYVPIPVSDRDYIIEIGYLTDGDRWVKIARSPITRVFSRPYGDFWFVANDELDEHSSVILKPRTPKWAYVAWQISSLRKQSLRSAGIRQLALRLYDITNIDRSYQSPQLVQQYECEEISNDRYVAIPASDRDYIVEVGYVSDGDRWVTIARSDTVRVFSRPQEDFWLVTDTEIIIHGATQPGATVTLGGNPINLKSDGTFHVRVPFSKELVDYLITAVAANGKQTKTTRKKLSQETPEN